MQKEGVSAVNTEDSSICLKEFQGFFLIFLRVSVAKRIK